MSEASRRASYSGERPDLARLVARFAEPGNLVIDVGCSTGAFGGLIQESLGVRVVGIERDPDLAHEAESRIERVLVGDAAQGLAQVLSDSTLTPRIVVFGDVLEHLVDPWSAFDQAVDLLVDGGHIVVSLPNVAHLDTFLGLLRGRWPMRSRGIHDDSHLRFFARRDVRDLMMRGGCRIVALEKNYRIVDRPSRINRFAWLIGWAWPNVLTYQFLVVASVPSST